MKPSSLLAAVGLLVASFATLAQPGPQHYQDPPGRVARIAHLLGDASFSPAGESAWLEVVRNRPLVRGDRLWTERGARLELQVGNSAVRLGGDTGVELLALDDRLAQFLLSEGSLSLSVAPLYEGQSIEIATPTLALVVEHAGSYRIDVDPRSGESTIIVREGHAEVWGDRSSFPLRAGDAVRFHGEDLRDHTLSRLPRLDRFDRYGIERDSRLARSPSRRYLGDDVLGYADLDQYGSWHSVSQHGNVWFPSRVQPGWAPYRDGYWVWQEPWGWTWVDNAPWGFAPAHYGRWAHLSGRWGWIPGPRTQRAVYAPALVAFVGGGRWSLSLSLGDASPIGWFPLGPREPYLPAYRTSREYFSRINQSNTTINNTTIVNIYNSYSSGSTQHGTASHANRQIAGAVTAVPGNVFAGARSVRQEVIRLDAQALASGEIVRMAAVAPTARSVLGSGQVARSKPRAETFSRHVVARSEPPASARPFAEREAQLQRSPGQPVVAGVDAARPERRAANRPGLRVLGNQLERVDARRAGPTRPDSAGGRTLRESPANAASPANRPAPVTSASSAARGRPEQDQTQRERAEPAQQGLQVQQQARQRAAAQQQQQQQQQAEAAQQQRQRAAAQQQQQQQAEAAQQQRQRAAAQQQQQQQAEAAQQQRQRAAAQQQQHQQAEAAQQQRQRSEQAQRQQQADVQQQRQATRPQAEVQTQRRVVLPPEESRSQESGRSDAARQGRALPTREQTPVVVEPRDRRRDAVQNRGQGKPDPDVHRDRSDQEADSDDDSDDDSGRRRSKRNDDKSRAGKDSS
jgi:hypothetical protein